MRGGAVSFPILFSIRRAQRQAPAGRQYAAALDFIAGVSEILGRPVKPGDDSGVCFIHQGRSQGRYPTRNVHRPAIAGLVDRFDARYGTTGLNDAPVM